MRWPSLLALVCSPLFAAESPLEAYFAQSDFSGVILLARGNEVIVERAYGYADFEQETAMRPDHQLRIGSLTKPVTAAAVLVAVKEGHLHLSDKICERLPHCPTSWAEVTIEHVLRHRSGIRDHFGDLEAVPVNETARELARVMSELPIKEALETEPGGQYAYSNFNYVMLGIAVEIAQKQPWIEVLVQSIFRPLSLSATGYDDVWAVIPGRARGFDRDAIGVLRHVEYDDHAAHAAGGLRSTARDMLRFSQAVFSGELLGPALTEASLSPPPGSTYGYGWQVREFFNRRIYNHTGGIDGFSSHIAHYPDEELTLIVLTNVESDSAILRACDGAALLFGWHGENPPMLAELTPRQRCGLE